MSGLARARRGRGARAGARRARERARCNRIRNAAALPCSPSCMQPAPTTIQATAWYCASMPSQAAAGAALGAGRRPGGGCARLALRTQCPQSRSRADWPHVHHTASWAWVIIRLQKPGASAKKTIRAWRETPVGCLAVLGWPRGLQPATGETGLPWTHARTRACVHA